MTTITTRMLEAQLCLYRKYAKFREASCGRRRLTLSRQIMTTNSIVASLHLLGPRAPPRCVFRPLLLDATVRQTVPSLCCAD